ncbi:DNA repair protein RecO [Umezakia ovalisporum]|jgi:DNA repair protein RecO (recombination protein O)|uniref:DNA repair protein RecO n=2 Tax=Umezakia ovalisporum TaxID=75695 RepID=A0AA43KDB1_9CYAN|nr:DNA repair protein RecO [Umezakia ovalisporum]MDH6056572.1 DNA repair protein RecO [Umezakia ovalisporum FSS-43]MDH6062337.1 DNA repair protein RecO [Umezakia ovalisporum FSS-62]MDH6067934.1 DNA repair protein RecO [Umezakia ovalisporum APH033B]MDH6069232.1 DNA repair protein RecO [Umezakia ovalisporum CobakiLakeA]MDH6083242.1 DNA repair protein RecO [Umezakia ovalisporum FSS-44]
MSRTYKATGINLKAQTLGESDRIVTILTREFGLIRAVAPGARKQNSSLGSRSAMFVVNELLMAKGRSLDKITQAQTVKTYPGLAEDLGKLAAGQYLAEIVLCQALSEQPQGELYELLNEYLHQLEVLPKTDKSSIYAYLAHGVFHFFALAGLSPQVQVCCLTQQSLKPDFTDQNWRVGFSVTAGGTVCLQAWENLGKDRVKPLLTPSTYHPNLGYQTVVHRQDIPVISCRLDATQLGMLQQLSQPDMIRMDATKNNNWLSVEQILRQYAQYHLGRPIRSATLIDSYFAANHDATV